MTDRRAAYLAIALLMAACSAPQDSPGASDQPVGMNERPSTPADCINPPPNVTTVIEQDDRIACYADDVLVLEAHASIIAGVVDCPGQLEPQWLHCTTLELRTLPVSGAVPPFLLAARVPDPGPALPAAIHPTYDIDLSRGLDALVTATGHFDDPAARTCHWVSWPDSAPPPADETIRTCRSTFVITHLEPLEVTDGEPSEPPAPDIGAFRVHDIAQVVETDLVVRTLPGVGPESEILRTALDAPALLYITDGPVSADGYDWYEVVPANLDYLPTGYRAGWIAAASRDGAPWIGRVEAVCPEPSSLLDVVSLSGVGKIACFGNDQVTLEGTFAGCSDMESEVIAGAWPFATLCSVTPDGLEAGVVPNPGNLTAYVAEGTAPGADDIGSRIQITGHFDDAAARECSLMGDAPVPPEAAILLCRSQFVATDFTILD